MAFIRDATIEKTSVRDEAPAIPAFGWKGDAQYFVAFLLEAGDPVLAFLGDVFVENSGVPWCHKS
uniref:Uncharacterized protein n=1 Tax=Candidatus Nitrotoga fabula TaxID=2182327 RepID=A0A2X0QUG3_9PROT|nr:protein of unknown function [Candidatus Nitrotoga fabula]